MLEHHHPVLYIDFTSENVKAELTMRVLIIPLGTIEQHGPHLPLSVDVDIAQAIATTLALRHDCVIAPAVTVGARSLPMSGGGPCFRGTLHIRGSLLIAWLEDVLTSYIAAGARRVLFLNSHFENEAFLFEAIECCRERGLLDRTSVVATSWWSRVDAEWLAQLLPRQFVGWHAEHASFCETSLMLHIRGDVVGEERPRHDTPPAPGLYTHPVAYDVSTKGVLSSAVGASAAAGEALLNHICDGIDPLVVGLKLIGASDVPRSVEKS